MEFDIDYEEPGPSQNRPRGPNAGTRPGRNLTTNQQRYNGGNQATQGPRRGRSANPGPRGNWRQRCPNAGNANVQRNAQWNGPRPRGNGNMQHRTPQRGAGPQMQTPVHHNQRNHNHTLNRQMRSRSEQNLDQSDGHVSNQPARRGKYVGFKFLLELSQSDSKQIITSINGRKEAFLELLQSPIERPDLYVLIIKILTTVSSSSFEQLKSNLMLDVCNSQFITNLRNYLMDLPYTERRSTNSMYWGKPEEFWENFISFCDYIIKTIPSIAMFKCRSLIEGTSKCCLEGLSQRHDFNLPHDLAAKLENIRKKLITQEEEKKVVTKRVVHEESEPPENFRVLSVLPQVEDLVGCRPYLRPNIVDGGYANVEHYLDIQFRLLREDCFGPLRDGIYQFLQNPNEKKFDNIRVFRDVKFVEPYVSREKIGSVVQVDTKTTKWFKTIKWAHSKRLIYGSLVLFTKDNCKTFIVATILDRDTKYLMKGKVPISLVDKTIGDDIYKTDDSYIMIESDVYFEPYFHVLKALQDPTFPEHIAMSKYIVQVDSIPQHPVYLNENYIYNYRNSDTDYEFNVLNESTWPTSDEMGLNESQYEAYRLALTHEFAVIQGPPGTGKTFLGVKVAKTLIKNLTVKGCLLLLICYTNHALDQFLENILPITNSIARIGGQSRNEAMEKFNLNYLRLNGTRIKHETNQLFLKQRSYLRNVVLELQEMNKNFEIIDNGVLNYSYVIKHIEESRVIGNYYGKVTKDPLQQWLFENMPINFDYDIHKDEEHQTNLEVDDDIYQRDDVILDDFEFMGAYGHEVSTSFSINVAKEKLQELMRDYRSKDNDYEKEQLMQEIIVVTSRISMYQEMSKLRDQGEFLEIDHRDPTQYSNEERWSIYFGWAEKIMNKLKESMIPLQTTLQEANTAYEETRMIMDLEVLRNVKVVGMTTSGAARLRKLLIALAPPIVIVEEAAEVLEQHIVTSLTKDCQHLILIGDHQQLRPSASHMRLARDYNLEVSLFERMIKNNIHSRRLCVQHRMRPDISALISPHIYPDLLNHHSVERFPNVLGMCNNLFFFTHNYQEEKVDDSSSKANHKEADMVLRLANYLMQQGYEPSDVTILAAYSGQMFYMRNQRERYAHLSKVKITVVDNYQGEESRIILLSLVRNNAGGHIGFLKTENRVCVALSRAKEGFYIFGNINMLKTNSNLWEKIAQTLESKKSLGTSLQLRCEVHENQITTITTAKDFEKVPEGGCLLKCNFNLQSCNHQCPLLCHGYDRKHVVIQCPLQCERVICALEHVCPLRCSQPCAPCRVPVLKELPCGHSKHLPCTLDPHDPSVKCHVRVDVTLPHCGHQANKPCYLDTRHVSCPTFCDARLKCGHVCVLNCHVTKDPNHENYDCEKPCAKAKKGCSMVMEGDLGPHQCLKKCHQTCDDCVVEVQKKRSNCKHTERIACNKNVDEKPCRKNCARMLECGHFCKKKCYEKCGDCREKVKKTIPECGHEVTTECSRAATRELCVQQCSRRLSCGHACARRCAEPCALAACEHLLPVAYAAPCGHDVRLPCNVARSVGRDFDRTLLLAYCTAACGAELACGHACGGGCARCRQRRLHAPCTQTCNQQLICGHRCEEPCNQVCPPCTKPCEVKCQHSKCKNLCGEPCVPCMEKCTRRCAHGACGRRCGDACARPACAAPCPRPAPCGAPGHRCRGLCGEPCPDICSLCRPDDFPRDFLGDDFEDDDKFVLLEDCNHVLELENMNNLMFGDKDTVSIRACPYCRKPIINTHRYKDFVNDMFKKEINPIKERVYGTQAQIKAKKAELKAKVQMIVDNPPKIYTDRVWLVQKWCSAFVILLKLINIKAKRSLLQLGMQFVYLNILEMLSDTYNLYVAANLVEFKDQVVKQIDMICDTLINNTKKISQQQQQDIGKEIKRMNSLIQLAKIASHPTYKISKNEPKVRAAFEKATAVVTHWTVYDENKGIAAMKLIQEEIKVSGIATKQERALIVQAIGLKAGHWYKCPNGHFYCIGECGGAMEVSKCIECGVAIGGRGHALLNTNRHAPEMDGSRFAAWSEEYNNMGNFNID
ncbi:NFX1-type zinc finger-containing protein 1-like [Epargyreus clarus]|uniref:NFX1-type zinc finger-containing protein 1-like n=1 Tax=Epargyreus clarus TaxID=520877 RepID=UPI003C2F1E57